MESLCLAAVLALVVAVAPSPLRLAPGALVALQVGTTAMSRVVARGAGGPARRGALLLLGGAAALLLWLRAAIAVDAPWTLDGWATVLTRPWALRPEVTGPWLALAWLVGAYLVGRGLLLGTQAPGAVRASRWFVAGMVALTAVVAAAAGGSVPEAQLASPHLRALIFAYFIAGMAATALAHRQAVGRRAGGGRAARVTASWALAVGLPIVGVMCLAALLAFGMGGLRGLAAMITDAARWTVHAVAWGLGRLLVFLGWLASLLPRGRSHPRAAPDGPSASSANDPAPPGGHDAIPQPALDVAPWAMGILAAAALFFLARALRRRLATARQGAPTVDEERTSLWSFRAWLRQLATWLRSRLGRRAPPEEAAARGGPIAPAGGAAEMRRVYRDLLGWAQRCGHARAPATTPLELAQELADAGVGRPADVDRVTAAYLVARYAEVAVPSDEVARARRIVDELSGAQGSRNTNPDGTSST
jgi:uncharacterized protein DUF4129